MVSTRLLLRSDIRRAPRRAVVTVGVFDGVHLAHQRLIRTTVTLARRLRATSVVLTFDPDPQHVLDPTHASPTLMPLHARVELLCRLGVGKVWILPFTKRFATMTAEAFIRRILIDRLHAVALVVGDRFLCGHQRRGDLRVLKTVGPAWGMRVVALPHVTRDGRPVSSSRIRRLISRGRLSQAAKLLGRLPALYGTVIRGAGRGHRLGFPTANLRVIPQVLPPQGVYAVVVEIPPAHRRWRGVMNLGVRPTFGGTSLQCEAHLLGFSGRLRGRSMTLWLLERLRAERRFSTPQALTRQITRDLIRAQRIFRSHGV